MPSALGPEEKALWGKVIATVKPLHGAKAKLETKTSDKAPNSARVDRRPETQKPGATTHTAHNSTRGEQKLVLEPNTLDSHWDRRIKRGGLVPDISIDLHDTNLSRAYSRLDAALEQAVAKKLKIILLVTGKPRAHDRASGVGRGAIAAVIRDWLAASRHAGQISAVRNAHPRHGGAGALYIILRG